MHDSANPDKLAIIIGATGGIGHVLSRMLAERGWSIVAGGRDSSKLVALQEELGEAVVQTQSLEAQKPGAVEELFQSHPGATGAVNLCGSILIKPLQATDEGDLEHAIDQNVRTSYFVAKAAAKAMRRAGGSVVLMSSCAARIGLPNHEIISAAKGAVEGLVRSAAASHAASGLRFNAVAPGLVETPLSSRITGSEQALKASVDMHPAGRIGQPEDIARVIAFLLEPESDWITGQVLGVDGGLAAIKGR